MPELVGDVVGVARHLLSEAGQEQVWRRRPRASAQCAFACVSCWGASPVRGPSRRRSAGLRLAAGMGGHLCPAQPAAAQPACLSALLPPRSFLPAAHLPQYLHTAARPRPPTRPLIVNIAFPSSRPLSPPLHSWCWSATTGAPTCAGALPPPPPTSSAAWPSCVCRTPPASWPTWTGTSSGAAGGEPGRPAAGESCVAASSRLKWCGSQQQDRGLQRGVRLGRGMGAHGQGPLAPNTHTYTLAGTCVHNEFPRTPSTHPPAALQVHLCLPGAVCTGVVLPHGRQPHVGAGADAAAHGLLHAGGDTARGKRGQPCRCSGSCALCAGEDVSKEGGLWGLQRTRQARLTNLQAAHSEQS
jgi:hypothetical protein